MTPSEHEALLEFSYRDRTVADRVERSIEPEVGEVAGDRTSVSLRREGETLLVTVRASDLTALRAGLNTWQSLVGVAEEMADGPS